MTASAHSIALAVILCQNLSHLRSFTPFYNCIFVVHTPVPYMLFYGTAPLAWVFGSLRLWHKVLFTRCTLGLEHFSVRLLRLSSFWSRRALKILP